MPELFGVSRPKASVSARVIKADGTIIDLGTIAGEGREDPANMQKGREARERLNRLVKEEEQNG